MTGETKKTVRSQETVKTVSLKQHQKSPVRYEEQMVLSSPSTVSSDIDPIKEAQETHEDATILKRFKILNLIGTGNYARVYRCTSSNGRELAVKSINLTKTSENYRKKFLPRELSILRRISHINICKIYEILQIADRIFIVMQLCSKGTIADLLHKSGPFCEPVARYLFVPIIDAVMYLHNLDLAHRDVKVENILLDNDFVPKLTDFSYSINTSTNSSTRKSIKARSESPWRLAPKTAQSPRPAPQTKPIVKLNETFCGTLPYLSPEMIRQNPYDPKKTDIWSLGVCLYVMLNDRLPFPFDDVRVMLSKQLSRDFRFKQNIDFSDASKDLVNRMLEPDFSKRLSSSDVSRHIWMSGQKEKPNL